MIERFSRGELSQKDAQLEIEHFWAGALRRAVIDGDVETGSLMAGQSVGLVTREQSTVEILDELVAQALAVIEREGGGIAADATIPRLADSRRAKPAGTGGVARRLSPRQPATGWRRNSPPAAPPARRHGRVGHRPGAARPHRPHRRRRDGRRGLLGLRDARRRGARTVRHRGAAARGGASHPVARRRGPGRRHRRDRAAAGAGRRPSASRFCLPARKPARRSITR